MKKLTKRGRSRRKARRKAVGILGYKNDRELLDYAKELARKWSACVSARREGKP